MSPFSAVVWVIEGGDDLLNKAIFEILGDRAEMTDAHSLVQEHRLAQFAFRIKAVARESYGNDEIRTNLEISHEKVVDRAIGSGDLDIARFDTGQGVKDIVAAILFGMPGIHH